MVLLMVHRHGMMVDATGKGLDLMIALAEGDDPHRMNVIDGSNALVICATLFQMLKLRMIIWSCFV